MGLDRRFKYNVVNNLQIVIQMLLYTIRNKGEKLIVLGERSIYGRAE